LHVPGVIFIYTFNEHCKLLVLSCGKCFTTVEMVYGLDIERAITPTPNGCRDVN